jgi:hypothetical protein
MDKNGGGRIVKAAHYIHDVCGEVIAVSKILQERFRQGLPAAYTVGELYTWPTQFPAKHFFEALGCWVDVNLKRPRAGYFGCAAYLFDLGGVNTLASVYGEPLILVGWTGVDADEEVYEIEHLEAPLAPTHIALGERLFCWIEDDAKPHFDPPGQSWCFAVPLLSVRTEEDVERLLVKPLIDLVIASQLTETVVEQAFNGASEVLTEMQISKMTNVNRSSAIGS